MIEEIVNRFFRSDKLVQPWPPPQGCKFNEQACGGQGCIITKSGPTEAQPYHHAHKDPRKYRKEIVPLRSGTFRNLINPTHTHLLLPPSFHPFPHLKKIPLIPTLTHSFPHLHKTTIFHILKIFIIYVIVCTNNLIIVMSCFNFSDVMEQFYFFVVVGYEIFVVGQKMYMVVAVYVTE